MKKFLSFVLSIIMAFTMSSVVAADFVDISVDNTYITAINELAELDIVRGTSDTTFNPDGAVKRYEMALLIARATTGDVGAEADNGRWTNGIVPFTDVTGYKGAISYAYANKIIKGRTETIFDPNGNIAYVDALTMAVRALGYIDLEYPWGFYNKAVELDLTANISIADLYTTLNRAETAQIIYNMIYAKRANSDVSFVAENFVLDIVRTSDLYIITATPAQSYFGTTTENYAEDKIVVGIQALTDGVPAGDVIYVPVEDLGIEAADVENYFNYAVELVDYDATKGTYYAANLGNAPVKVYTADVKFDKDADTNNKLTIAGKTYTLADDSTGRNALVAFAGASVTSTTRKVLEFLDDGISVFYNNTVVAKYAGKISGVKYYEVKADGSYIDEATAISLWGKTLTDAAFAEYETIKAADIKDLGAFELQLFDDNNDGKYDRAIANPVYLSVYGTFEQEINNKKAGKETVDIIASEFANEAVDADNVIYSEELTVGTLFTFTYNSVTNTIYVVETFDLNTAKLNKIDTTAEDGTFEFTFGETAYIAQGTYTPTDLGAILVDYNLDDSGLTLKNLKTGLVCNVMTDWADFLKTNALGYEYNFYVINGLVIFAEPVEEEVIAATKTEFVILDSVADFDFDWMDLKVYTNGNEQVVALNKFKDDVLSEFSKWDYNRFVEQTNNFLKGYIYAVTNTANGINVLDFVDNTNYADYTYKDVDGKTQQYFQYIDLTNDNHGLINDDTITFDRGIVRKGANDTDLAYEDRIRATSSTIFYFIDYGTGIENEADTEIEVYVGAPEEGTITLNEYSYILVDQIGYTKNNDSQGSTQLIIVVNPTDYDFDIKVERDTYGLFIGNENIYVADDATDLGLEGYAKGTKFYEFKDGAIDIDTGKAITIYAPINTLVPGTVYEFDTNGVILGYEDMTTAPTGTTLAEIADLSDTDKYGFYNGQDVIIDYFVEEKIYEVSIDGDIIYDEYVIKAATLVNIGDDITLTCDDSFSNLEYAKLSSTTTWNKIVNFFKYDDTNSVESDVFVVKISNTELFFFVAVK